MKSVFASRIFFALSLARSFRGAMCGKMLTYYTRLARVCGLSTAGRDKKVSGKVQSESRSRYLLKVITSIFAQLRKGKEISKENSFQKLVFRRERKFTPPLSASYFPTLLLHFLPSIEKSRQMIIISYIWPFKKILPPLLLLQCTEVLCGAMLLSLFLSYQIPGIQSIFLCSTELHRNRGRKTFYLPFSFPGRPMQPCKHYYYVYCMNYEICIKKR